MTGAMFTSLNVVRIALVCCDSSSRSAIRARRRDIGTRCSGRSLSHWSAPGAFTSGSDGFAAFGTAAGAGAAFATGVATAVPCPAESASPLVIRPSRPVPLSSSAARFFSAISLLAAGRCNGARRNRSPMRLSRRPAHLAPLPGSALGCRCAAPASLRRCPTRRHRPCRRCRSWRSLHQARTMSPSCLTTCASTPADGAGTSSTTLSVSISIRISSCANRLTGLLFPLQHRRFRHRLRQLGNFDFDNSHLNFLNAYRMTRIPFGSYRSVSVSESGRRTASPRAGHNMIT